LTDDLLVERHGAIRVVTLNRPDELNVIDRALHRRLLDVWHELNRDPEARCVVLTGAGRAFSGGGDFAFLKAQHQSLELRYLISHEAGEIINAMLNFRLPVIAAVNGPAIGLGASLVLSSDLIVMSERSYLSDPHVSIGLPAGDGGALLWPYYLSIARAKEYIYTGERITAQRCAELGMANRVTDPDALLTTALELADRLAGKPARALQMTKRIFAKHLSLTAAAIIDFGLATETVELGAEEHIDQIRAFLGEEKYDALEVSDV
jgi:enoyl-CoA hydratase